MTENVKRTLDFLHTVFNASAYFSTHPQERDYRLDHTIRVANLGARIAKSEGMDVEAMTIACLLHDIAYCNASENTDWWKDHGRASARIARPFLRELDLKKEKIDEICFGIAIHVDDRADFPGYYTTFAQTVGDSDNIDRFGACRLNETLQKANLDALPLEEKLAFVRKRLSSLNKLRTLRFSTRTADGFWKENLDSQINYYQFLLRQFEMSGSIGGEEYTPSLNSQIFPPIIPSNR